MIPLAAKPQRKYYGWKRGMVYTDKGPKKQTSTHLREESEGENFPQRNTPAQGKHVLFPRKTSPSTYTEEKQGYDLRDGRKGNTQGENAGTPVSGYGKKGKKFPYREGLSSPRKRETLTDSDRVGKRRGIIVREREVGTR